MQIILLESIERVGKAGEIVAVKDGYANNFLLPKKLAIVANKKNRSELDSKMDNISKQNDIKISEANSLKDSLDKISLTMRVESNDEDALYGAVTQKQISDLLKAQGHNILNENIVTGEIKTLGEFNITIKIYEDITSTIKISLEKN
ncbi:50S ribosomal protein L9, partial [Pelagibacteraceae bacterium]|jgi:large subunit ribosomal protein L9|nr:50S ribosomal protein L9 [Pelagibacteraceae bacterium]